MIQYFIKVRKVKEGWVAWVSNLDGANTQGKTLKEALTNLGEAIELVEKGEKKDA